MVTNPRYEPVFPEDISGTPMTEEAFEQLISIESPYRYELIDGLIYNMTNTSPEHTDIADNMTASFKEQLGRQGPCRVYQNQCVVIPGKPSVMPDIVITCDVADRDKNKRLQPFKVRSPLIVVEVLSPSTQMYDRTEKFARYKRCSTLEVYILASQYEPFVEVYRRATGWKRECFAGRQVVMLDQLDLELPLEAVYEGVF